MYRRPTVEVIDGKLVFGSEVVNALPQMSVQVARYLLDEGHCTKEAYKDFVMSEDPNFKLKMINNINMSTELYIEAISKWGEAAQVEMIIEECSELILAIQKYKRDPSEENMKQIQDECADVTIMMEQAQVLFGSEAIEARKKFKLSRLRCRLDKAVPVDASQLISDSVLSVRTKNTCAFAELVTVADLAREYRSGNLVKYRNFGIKSLNEVELFLGGKLYE